MRRRSPRQPSLKECYAILRLEPGADLAALKRAYRRRAFELHPDLHPGQADAGRKFQLLNEAYVALSAVLQPGPEEAAQPRQEQKAHEDDAAEGGPAQAAGPAADPNADKGARAARAEGRDETERPAGQAEDRAEDGTADAATDAQAADRQSAAGRAAYAEHDVLRDLLNDPFARRVFEDIYSELNRQQATPPPQAGAEAGPQSARARARETAPKTARLHRANLLWGAPKGEADPGGVTGLVKGWLRRQIDEEQSLTLPAAHLAPGKRVRLQIRQAFSGELRTVEITLPPDFAVGKPVRLRGLGKRVGPWQGDLYLTLHNA